MKKWMTAGILALMLMTATMPAQALTYQIDAPDGALFADATSVEQVIVAGGGVSENANTDRSKNAALLPPPFGSPESYLSNTGTLLTSQPGSSTTVSVPGSSGTYTTPSVSTLPPESGATNASSNLFTLPDGLFYTDGSLGRLKIPSLSVNVKVYEDESLENLAKGVGHFKSTSCWDGNVGLAAHNRGASSYFSQIHTLEIGDQITYTTKLGTRTYRVFFVGQIKETDFSRLDRANENMLTLITCVRDVRDMRWCVQAREII